MKRSDERERRRHSGRRLVPSLVEKGQSLFTDTHALIFRSTDGRAGRVFRGSPVLLLITMGRKTGKRRTTPLMHLRDGEDFVVVASNGGAPKHPAWFLNLRANPEATVEVGGRKLRVRAQEAGPKEKGRLWPELVAMYPNFQEYQKTERELPVIVLRPAGGMPGGAEGREDSR
jgi:F420H(2)-dependent quinone reductase